MTLAIRLVAALVGSTKRIGFQPRVRVLRPNARYILLGACTTLFRWVVLCVGDVRSALFILYSDEECANESPIRISCFSSAHLHFNSSLVQANVVEIKALMRECLFAKRFL